jgi:hypothetical protein
MPPGERFAGCAEFWEGEAYYPPTQNQRLSNHPIQFDADPDSIGSPNAPPSAPVGMAAGARAWELTSAEVDLGQSDDDRPLQASRSPAPSSAATQARIPLRVVLGSLGSCGLNAPNRAPIAAAARDRPRRGDGERGVVVVGGAGQRWFVRECAHAHAATTCAPRRAGRTRGRAPQCPDRCPCPRP